MCRVIMAGLGPHDRELRLHEVADRRIRRHRKKVTRTENADRGLVGVQNIDCPDRPLGLECSLDRLHRLGGSARHWHCHDPAIHDVPDGALRIFAGVLQSLEIGQQACHPAFHAFRERTKRVQSHVRRHLFKQFAQVPFGLLSRKRGTIVPMHICQHATCFLFGKPVEKRACMVKRHMNDQVSQILRRPIVHCLVRVRGVICMHTSQDFLDRGLYFRC